MSNTRKMRKVAAVVMGAMSLSLIATGAAADWKPSQPIEFILRNTDTGEQTVYRSQFMGPR